MSKRGNHNRKGTKTPGEVGNLSRTALEKEGHHVVGEQTWRDNLSIGQESKYSARLNLKALVRNDRTKGGRGDQGKKRRFTEKTRQQGHGTKTATGGGRGHHLGKREVGTIRERKEGPLIPGRTGCKLTSVPCSKSEEQQVPVKKQSKGQNVPAKEEELNSESDSAAPRRLERGRGNPHEEESGCTPESKGPLTGLEEKGLQREKKGRQI